MSGASSKKVAWIECHVTSNPQQERPGGSILGTVGPGSQGWRDILCFLLCLVSSVWLHSLVPYDGNSKPMVTGSRVLWHANTSSAELSGVPSPSIRLPFVC